jgi:hypothetical protein
MNHFETQKYAIPFSLKINQITPKHEIFYYCRFPNYRLTMPNGMLCWGYGTKYSILFVKRSKEMKYGKNVRSPSLVQGSDYVMKTWGKEPTFQGVTFGGFVSGGQLFKSPNRQLKDMVPTDYYKLMLTEGEVSFKGKMMDNCLVHETSEARITFFYPDGVSAPAKVTTPKTTRAKKNTPAPTPEELAAAAKKAKQEAANLKKRQARAAAKAAKEAATQQTGTQDEEANNAAEHSGEGEENSGVVLGSDEGEHSGEETSGESDGEESDTDVENNPMVPPSSPEEGATLAS